MDAVEFLKQYSRMVTFGVQPFKVPSNLPYEEIVSRVEQWAKEHPVKTRQSEFLKRYPEAEIGDDGHPSVDPCQLHKEMANVKVHDGYCNKYGCDECRRDFWLAEIKDEEA